MPVVPVYQPNQIENQAPAIPQVTAAAFGGGNNALLGQAAKAGETAGAATIATGVRLDDKLDKAQVRDALSSAQNEVLDYVSNNVLTAKGKDATAILPTAQENFTKIRDKYTTGLSPTQQAMFTGMYAEIYNHGSNITRNHQFQQTEDYSKSTLTSENSSYHDTAVADPRNPAIMADAENHIIANTNALNAGFPEQAKMQGAAAVSHLYTDAVKNLAGNDPSEALSYAQQNKSKFLPATYDAVHKELLSQTVTQAAAQKADASAALPKDQRQGVLDAEQDPVKKQLLEHSYALYDNAQAAAAARKVGDSSTALVSQIMSNPAAASSIIGNGLPPEQKAALMAQANTMVAGPVQTDFSVYSNLVDQAHRDPQAFLGVDMKDYLGKLSPDDWNDIANIRNGIENKRKDTAIKVQDSKVVNDEITNQMNSFPELILKENGKGVTTDGTGKVRTGQELANTRQAITDLRLEISREISDASLNGKSVSAEDAVAVVRKVMARKVVERSWFGADKTLPQGLVDVRPSLDKTVPAPIRGISGIKQTPFRVDGKTVNGYVRFDDNGAPISIFDEDGKPINAAPKK